MPEDTRLRIAVIATEDRPRSHTDVIISRWLEPREGDAAWGWPKPRTRIASVYLDQFPDNDLGRERCKRFNVPIYPTIHEALCLGGHDLVVDGVLLIGEHGDYPWNDLGQQLYPRKRLFDGIVRTFEDTGKTAPVFCDKHYSWNFDWARQMTETADAMGFMLFGGSTLPFCRQIPALNIQTTDHVEQAVFVFYGGDEAYGYHSIEFAQSLLEHRRGGESGIRNVTAWRGAQAWQQLDRCVCPPALAEAAVVAIRDADPSLVTGAHMRGPVIDPTLYLFEYADGMRVAHINLSGHVASWGMALQVAGESEPRVCTPVMGVEEPDYFAHFATLCRIIEDAFISGEPPFALKRSLLTTGAIAAAMHARATPGATIETPHLAIAYQPIPQANPGHA